MTDHGPLPDITADVASELCDTHLNQYIEQYRAGQLTAAAICASMLHNGDVDGALTRAAESVRLGNSLDLLIEERAIRRTITASIAEIQRETERNQQ